MLNVSYDESFLDKIRKIKDTGLKRRIIKQVEKIFFLDTYQKDEQ